MPSNKIGYQGQSTVQPPLQMSLSPSEVMLVPDGQGVLGTFGAQAVGNNVGTQALTGQYHCTLGPYLSLQQYDTNLQVWRNVHAYSGGPHFISSDGTNYRVANLTGCPVGAVITNAGTGLTNGFNTVTVTPSAGGSTWNTIVGGAVNTSIAVTGNVYASPNPFGVAVSAPGFVTGSGGSNYTKPPVIVFGPPANQGSTPYILPTATCVLSSGAVSTITVENQGAGLVGLPSISFVNQLGDTTGGGAVAGWTQANATNVGTGTLVWMGVNSPGNTGAGLTAACTFTFSPASTIAATAVMNFVVTGYTGTGGTGFGTNALIVSGASTTPGTPAYTNPNYDKLWIMSRPARLYNITTAGAINITAANIIIDDAGFGLEAVPTLYPSAVSGLPTAGVTLTATVGGINDFFSLQPI